MNALALVVALAFALRVAWQLAVGFYDGPETWEYDALARSLLAGRYDHEFLGSSWLTFGTPVYPAVLALLHLLSGGPSAYLFVGLGQALLSALLCLPAAAIARWLLPRSHERAPLLAAGLVAISPPLILYAAKVHELTFEALVAASLVATALPLVARPDARRALAAGVLGGLAALSRPTLLPLASLIALATLVRSRRCAAIVALSLLVIVVPWSVRNAIVLGTASLGSPYTCVTLWMGNHAGAPGGTLALDGRHVLETMPPEMKERVVGRGELEQGRVFCEEGGAWLLADPGRAAGSWLTKLGYFWWFSPTEGALYPPRWIDAYRFAWAVEAALAALGIVVILRRGARGGLLIVLAELLTVSAGQSFFYVEGRHRLLLEPSIGALAAIGLVAAVGRIDAFRGRALSGARAP